MDAIGEAGTIVLIAFIGIAIIKVAMSVFPIPILKDIAAL